jgi:hypothetical protein
VIHEIVHEFDRVVGLEDTIKQSSGYAISSSVNGNVIKGLAESVPKFVACPGGGEARGKTQAFGFAREAKQCFH